MQSCRELVSLRKASLVNAAKVFVKLFSESLRGSRGGAVLRWRTLRSRSAQRKCPWGTPTEPAGETQSPLPPEARPALLRVNSENSPVDCFRKRGILAENAPKLWVRLSSRAAPRRRVKSCSRIVYSFKSRIFLHCTVDILHF